MMKPLKFLTVIALLGGFSTAWAADQEPNYVVGARNPELYQGSRHLQAGRNEKGIELTLIGLENANDKREEEAALSNLCAGYTNHGDYNEALRYCNILLGRNDKAWRAYVSKAFIYIRTKQYEKAEDMLVKGEALKPSAYSLKIARALYLDATQPVAPVVEIDDRDGKSEDG